jgi:hypothetical protein
MSFAIEWLEFPLCVCFLIGIVWSGVQLGQLGTAATNRPVEPAPGDYDDGEIGGMMSGRGNRSTRRKPASMSLCPPQNSHACPDANHGRRGGKPATNRLSYRTAFPLWVKILARKPAIVTSVSRGFRQSFCQEVYLKLDHDHLRPHPFQFIVRHRTIFATEKFVK